MKDNPIMLVATDLFTHDKGFVTTVQVPPFTPPVEVIQWGSRFFVRQADGTYVEGLVWVAVNELTESP